MSVSRSIKPRLKPKKRRPKERIAATVVIHRPADMTDKGRRDIAKWLRRFGAFLTRRGNDMAPRFRARFMY